MSPRFQVIHGGGRAAVGGGVAGFVGTRNALREDERAERSLELDERRIGAYEEQNRIRAGERGDGQRMRRASAELNLLLNLPNELSHLAPGIAAAGRTFGGDSVDGVRLLDGLSEDEWSRLAQLDPEDQSRYLVRRAETMVSRRREDARAKAIRMLDSPEWTQEGGMSALPPEVIGKLRQDILSAEGQDVDAAVKAIDSAVLQESKRREDEREKLVVIEDLEARAQRMRDVGAAGDLTMEAEEALGEERKRLLGLADDVRLGRITHKEARAALRGMGSPGEKPRAANERGPSRGEDEEAPEGYWDPPATDQEALAEREAMRRDELAAGAARTGGPAGVAATIQAVAGPGPGEQPAAAPEIATFPVPDAMLGEVKTGPAAAADTTGSSAWPQPRPLTVLRGQYEGVAEEFESHLRGVFKLLPTDPERRYGQLVGLFRAYGVDPRDPEVQQLVRTIGAEALEAWRQAQPPRDDTRQFGGVRMGPSGSYWFEGGATRDPEPKGDRPKEDPGAGRRRREYDAMRQSQVRG